MAGVFILNHLYLPSCGVCQSSFFLIIIVEHLTLLAVTLFPIQLRLHLLLLVLLYQRTWE